MAAEEDDYMSDIFTSSNAIVRPGLLTKAQKRKIKATSLPSAKKKKVIEDEKRQQGLATPLSKDNIGFTLLQKMGYKQETGIGKSGSAETGLIPLVLKDGRCGLGRGSYVKERQAARMSQRQQQEKQTVTDFMQRKQQVQVAQWMESDLKRSQGTCEQLDEALGYEEPTVSWFWIPTSEEPEEDDDSSDTDDEEPTVAEKLVLLTDYLRTNHFYCVWCGTSYESSMDMSTNCPGNTREQHEM